MFLKKAEPLLIVFEDEMKINARKRQQLFSIFIDFALLMLAFSLVIGAIFFLKFLLFSSFGGGGGIYIMTEALGEDMIDNVRVGDKIYDTVTKMQLGAVLTRSVVEYEGEYRLLLYLDAEYFPKSKHLRTPNLWFEYSIVEYEENNFIEVECEKE